MVLRSVYKAGYDSFPPPELKGGGLDNLELVHFPELIFLKV